MANHWRSETDAREEGDGWPGQLVCVLPGGNAQAPLIPRADKPPVAPAACVWYPDSAMYPIPNAPSVEPSDDPAPAVVWTAVPTDWEGGFQRRLALATVWFIPTAFLGFALWTLITGQPRAWIFLACAAAFAPVALLTGRVYRLKHLGRITIDPERGVVVFEHLRFQTFWPSGPFERFECPFDDIRWVQHWRNPHGPAEWLYIQTAHGRVNVNSASTDFDLLHEALIAVGRNDPIPLTKSIWFPAIIGVAVVVLTCLIVLICFLP